MISVLFDSLQSHLHSGQGFTGASVVVVVVNNSAKIITLHGEKCDIYSEIYLLSKLSLSYQDNLSYQDTVTNNSQTCRLWSFFKH